MRRRWKQAGSTAAVVVLAGALLVSGAGVEPASATVRTFAPPPDPVAFPSSVLASIGSAPVVGTPAPATLTPAQWDQFLTAHPELAPTQTAATWGGKAGAMAGAAGTAVTGFAVGFDMGGDIARAFGLSETGDAWCDLSQVVTGDSGCAVRPADVYAPNSDLPFAVPGYSPVNATMGTADPQGWSGVQVTMLTEPTGLPAFGAVPAAGATYSPQILERLSGACSGTPGWTPVVAAALVFTDGSRSAAQRVQGGPGSTCTNLQAIGTYPGLRPYRSDGSGPLAVAGMVFLDASSQIGVHYWLPGAAQRPADPIPDPQRWWRTTWTCSSGQVGSRTSDPWHETDAEWPGYPSASGCDGGTVTSLLVEQITEGGPTTQIIRWDMPQAAKDWLSTRPDCSRGGCTLGLYRIDPQTDRRLDCLQGGSLCDGWLQLQRTDPTTADETYECQYGGQVVALAECTVYGDKPDNGRLADPATGEEAPPVTQPDPSPQPQSDCPPPFSWLSLFNPWWYYKGFTCGLEWAFVPSQASTQAWGDFVDEIGSRAPVSYMIDGIDWIDAAAKGVGSGSCADGPFDMGGPYGHYDMCATASAIRHTTWGTALYSIVQVLIVGGGLFIAWKRIAASFGGKG